MDIRRLSRNVGYGLVLLLVTTLVACDPGASVAIVNETNETIQLWLDGEDMGEVRPGEAPKLSALEGSAVDVYVTSLAGLVLLDRTYSWDDLREMGFSVTVGSD